VDGFYGCRHIPRGDRSAGLDLAADHGQTDGAGRARDGADLFPAGDHGRTTRNRCVRAQTAQQTVDVTAGVDPAHELLAQEATLGERDRVALEEGLLRDRRLVDVETLTGNTGFDAHRLVGVVGDLAR